MPRKPDQIVEFQDDQNILADRQPMDTSNIQLTPTMIDPASQRILASTEDQDLENVDDLEQRLASEEPKVKYRQRMQELLDARRNIANDEYEDTNKQSTDLRDRANLLRSFQGVLQGAGQMSNPNFRSDMSVADDYTDQAKEKLAEYYKRNEDERKTAENIPDVETKVLKASNLGEASDETSPYSRYAQDAVIKANPDVDENTVRKMSALQLLEYMKMKKQGGENTKKYTWIKRQMPNGDIKWIRANAITGEVDDTDMGVPYAPTAKKNPYTEDYEVINPALGTSTPLKRGTFTQGPAAVVPGTTANDQPKVEIPSDPYSKLNPKQRQDFKVNVLDPFEARSKEDDLAVNKLDEITGMLGRARAGDPTVKGQLKGMTAKMFEGGRLTDEDVERYLGRYDLSGKLKDKLAEISTGNFSGETLDYIEKGLQQLKTNKEKSMENKARELSARYYNMNKGSMDSVGVRPEDFMQLIKPKAPPEQVVWMKSPDGQRKQIKRSQVQYFLDKGAKIDE